MHLFSLVFEEDMSLRQVGKERSGGGGREGSPLALLGWYV